MMRLLLVLGVLALAACDGMNDGMSDGMPGNPPSTATQRGWDRLSGSGPTPADGTPGNPPGTAADRTYDRATGSNTSGAYPANSGGVPQR
jgi:hypothetical protein